LFQFQSLILLSFVLVGAFVAVSCQEDQNQYKYQQVLKRSAEPEPEADPQPENDPDSDLGSDLMKEKDDENKDAVYTVILKTLKV
jgi:hypothetical protein